MPELVPDWDRIPGARGCTPESCGFRDHHQEIAAMGAEVFGLSTQSTDDQREAAERLLPFPPLTCDFASNHTVCNTVSMRGRRWPMPVPFAGPRHVTLVGSARP